MRPALHTKFVDKAVAALTAAVEIYNKPNFSYREETFAILALNAWELLLKAKLIKDSGNDPRVIRVYQSKSTKKSVPSKKQYLKRNRAGNPMTKGLHQCIADLDKNSLSRLDNSIKNNLEALIEIRDNAVHYLNASPILARQILELDCACIKNFVILTKQWFSTDLSKSISLVLPLSFIDSQREIDSITVNNDENKLIKYLQKLGNAPADSSRFDIAIKVDVKLHRSPLTSATKVTVVSDQNDPEATKIIMSEENVLEKFPWSYDDLIKNLKKRYSDFKLNKSFHARRKLIQVDAKLAKERLLDPQNPRSLKKTFYNPNIVNSFDIFYTKKITP
jgi:hypothetical protein